MFQTDDYSILDSATLHKDFNECAILINTRTAHTLTYK